MPVLKGLMARHFRHSTIREMCEEVTKQNPSKSVKPALGPSPLPAELKQFATAFVELHQKRQEADYDTLVQFTKQDVSTLISQVRAAIDAFNQVHDGVLRSGFLMLLLLGRTPHL